MSESFDWLFTKAPRSKAFNDQDNKKREQILGSLLSPDPRIRKSLIDGLPDSKYWLTLRDKLVSTLSPLLSDAGTQIPAEQVFVKNVGGRSANYDLLAYKGKLISDSSGFKLEFKRGSSIYDHPQILSMYATKDFLIKKSAQAYPEYFYDNFIQKVETLVKTKKPERSRYLSTVFGTNSSVEPYFETCYTYAKAGGSTSLQDIADESIDSYFTYLLGLGDFLDLSKIQEKLDLQYEKTFLSWDYKTQRFNLERITPGSLTLKTKPRFKKSRKGKVHTLILDTSSGAEVHALLRWKNHPCVQGPAYQIKVTAA